jgi:hypothetical protein
MALQERVEAVLAETPVFDLHTHLFGPEFGELCRWGIDELLTYHYLVAEALRADPATSPEAFYSWTQRQQADFIWRVLFVERTPLSEAATGAITVLSAFRLDPAATNLHEARAFFADRDPEGHCEEVFRLAGVDRVVMTNDPLDPVERARWDAGVVVGPRYRAALRIDPIVNAWAENAAQVGGDFYAARKFLDRWIARMNPLYMAISLPDDFAYPEDSDRSRLLDQVVLPTCREHGLPFAMMVGVRRGVNPRLRSAGDGVGPADLANVARLLEHHPDNRFLVTTLARENAQGLCVLARKFANMLPFGCWWFMNNPSLVTEVTRMRLEMLGTSFVPQHSDARVMEQIIYKWSHSRRDISRALSLRYSELDEAGRTVTDVDIRRDVRTLMIDLAQSWLEPRS